MKLEWRKNYESMSQGHDPIHVDLELFVDDDYFGMVCPITARYGPNDGKVVAVLATDDYEATPFTTVEEAKAWLEAQARA